MTFLVFLGESSLLEGVGVVSACPKVLKAFNADIFEVNPLIIIPAVPFPTYQVLTFARTKSTTKFEY